MEIAFIGMFAFLLRCYGPANYGIFVIAVSALVVFLFAMTGVAPSEVVAARGLNTAVGGLLAIAVYAVWPTWARMQLRDDFAAMLDAYRAYFRAIRESYINPDQETSENVDQYRVAGRRARSNVEASFERFSSEPRATAEAVQPPERIIGEFSSSRSCDYGAGGGPDAESSRAGASSLHHLCQSR